MEMFKCSLGLTLVLLFNTFMAGVLSCIIFFNADSTHIVYKLAYIVIIANIVWTLYVVSAKTKIE